LQYLWCPVPGWNYELSVYRAKVNLMVGDISKSLRTSLSLLHMNGSQHNLSVTSMTNTATINWAKGGPQVCLQGRRRSLCLLPVHRCQALACGSLFNPSRNISASHFIDDETETQK
jgi:hypothetical protein